MFVFQQVIDSAPGQLSRQYLVKVLDCKKHSSAPVVNNASYILYSMLGSTKVFCTVCLMLSGFT